MIRRDDGGDWLIIEQIKHANLAADIARAWGNEQFESLAPHHAQSSSHIPERATSEDQAWKHARAAFFIAVSYHDNGWSEWDWAPRVDPRTGMPRDFREMRMRCATAIWTKSISGCAKPHPLSAYAVSRHFCYLADQVRNGGRHDADDLAAVARFLGEQAKMQAKLEQRSALYGWGEAFHRHRELGYRMVQFFDRVSLWLCCADEREPQSMTAPMGEVVTFSSRPAATVGEEIPSTIYRLQAPRPDYQKWQVVVEPYPLSGDTHEFSVDARRIPARPYADDADLQTTWSDAPTVQLVWTFGKA
jgi:hypothetical protein